MANEPIEQLGKGALVDEYDARDFTLEVKFGAAEPVDFSKETRLEEPVDYNQSKSSSCVGCGGRNLHWSVNKLQDWSRRNLYSNIYIPGEGGAYLRDVVKFICDVGNQNQSECPDPKNPTEQQMRTKSNLPDSTAAFDGKEANYFVVKNNLIDAVAQAVRDYKGAIFGVVGSNAGWTDKTNPRPPRAGESLWQHCIFAFGYHMHGGQKCIIAKSSWCSGSHHEHHIKQEYFSSGNTFNAWCIIPKEQNEMQTNSIIVKREVGHKENGETIWEYGIYDPDTAEAGLIGDLRNRGIQPPLKTDGTLDWEKLENMVSGVIIPNK